MGNNAKEKPDKPQSHDCRISLHFTEQEHVYLEHHQSRKKMHQKQTFLTKGTRKLFSCKIGALQTHCSNAQYLTHCCTMSLIIARKMNIVWKWELSLSVSN